ncbi:MAG: hypothetical protein EAS52_26035 [Parapedobacter sp.]|nr:MAG: hypothetical protein EAS52_26035 [Parapedobacter sp.]
MQIIDRAGFDFSAEERASREISWTCSKQLPKNFIILIVLSLRYFSLNWLQQRLQTTNKDFYPTIVLDAFHVTDEMATRGVEDGLEPVVKSDDWAALEKAPAKVIKRDIEKLKKKAAKR